MRNSQLQSSCSYVGVNKFISREILIKIAVSQENSKKNLERFPIYSYLPIIAKKCFLIGYIQKVHLSKHFLIRRVLLTGYKLRNLKDQHPQQ